jgi:hypothetical protein
VTQTLGELGLARGRAGDGGEHHGDGYSKEGIEAEPLRRMAVPNTAGDGRNRRGGGGGGGGGGASWRRLSRVCLCARGE